MLRLDAGQWNRLAVQARQMDVRMVSLLGTAALALMAAAVSGSGGGASARPDGAQPGCENVARPSVVQVRRTVQLPQPGLRPLSVTQRHPAVVRRWYDDACAIMSHPYHPPSGSVWNCPADFGLAYRGVFFAGKKKVAVLTYKASGCAGFTLSAGAGQASTMFLGPGAPAEARFDADLAAVFGIQPGALTGS